MMTFFRSRRWVATRRLILVFIALVIAYRNWGDTLTSRLRGPDAQRDIIVTHAEFRPGLGEVRPSWFIRLRNQSARYTYDKIQVEATYFDKTGKVVTTANLVISQKLTPGHGEMIGSLDVENRGEATHGTLRVLGAEIEQ